MRVAWVHAFSGVAGDMLLGALLDCGAELAEVRSIVERLGVPGWSLDAEATQRCGVGATRAIVNVVDDAPERTFATIRGLIASAALPSTVERRALATFTALAEVEGRLHGQHPDDVHFHEVGGLDAIVDVVGVCAALEVLGVEQLVAGPVAVGTGTVRAAHGLLPNPAPAVTGLLAAAGLRAHGLDEPMELTTPTGAALLAALSSASGPLPTMTVRASGFGAGTRDLPGRPNVTQVVLGDAAVVPALSAPGQPVDLVEVNVDDVTGEVLAHTIAAALEAGAHDAWCTPIVMKKGRPAHTVHALCDPALLADVARVLADETGSLGVRATHLERWPSTRATVVVEVDGHPVRVKVGPGRAKAEHDDAAAAARALGRPLRDVQRAALDQIS